MTRRMADADFAAVRDYLRRTAGLEFDQSRRPGLAAVVFEEMEDGGHPDVASYLMMLDEPGSAAQRQRLLDGVTIQETHFHRARPQIEALRHQLLPGLLAQAAAEHRELVVWSAGCATGEEPYTLAMLLLETAVTMPAPPRMRVVGTDVSAAALAVAQAATYSGRTVNLAEADAVSRWLIPNGDGGYAVRDEVRDLVQLRHHNLVTDGPPVPLGSVDLIVCRHVTIYFSRETTRALAGRFRAALRPTGWLLLGPAETLWQVSDAFEATQVGGAFVYRPVAADGAPGADSARRSAPVPAPFVPRASSRAYSPLSVPSPTPIPGTVPWVQPSDALAAALAAFDAGAYDDASIRSAALVDRSDVDEVTLARAYALLGHALLNRGEAVRAVEPLQRAVYLAPRAGHAHFLLAVAQTSLGKPALAGPAFRAAAEALPHTEPAEVDRILDGRQVDEVVQLCHLLADEAGRAVEPARRGA